MMFAIIAALLGPIAIMGGSAPSAGAQGWAPPNTVYMAETGHTLDRVFLDQWRDGGGAATYGYPVTPEITQDDGTIVQYLQYARFEYHPEGNANGNVFALGQIGEELRPFNLQRSVASFTSTGGSGGESAAAAASFAKAWMPVDAASVTSDSVRYVEETGHTIRYSFRTFWEATGEASYLGNPLTEQYVMDGVTYQVFERGQLGWENGSEATMVPVGQMLAEKYRIDQAPVAQGNIPTYSEDLFVPPPTPTPEPAAVPYGPGPVAGTSKSIVVSISQQRMWAYEGDSVFLTTLVSTGRPGFDTPTGMFSISKKVPMQDMEGLIGGEYYNVTDVPDVMYFTTVGHAFHGTYWHNNFGAVMSHGCINVPMDLASVLYEWTPMYTQVQIVD
jgi:lipoprotein-anchoring transpeptidase ErfK/SrfK